MQDPTKNEDRSALLAKKSFSVVTRDDTYDWWHVEEDFIQFLLEKVVMMRELPYMKAVLTLERE